MIQTSDGQSISLYHIINRMVTLIRYFYEKENAVIMTVINIIRYDIAMNMSKHWLFIVTIS